MNKYQTAIAEITDRTVHTLKTTITAQTSELVIETLQAQAERDEMRCENCNLKDTEFCRAVWKTKYNIKKEKWTYKTMMETDGFCSRFEPKENEI